MSNLLDTFNRLIKDPSIWAEVRANRAKLNSCDRHRFDPPADRKLGDRLTCTRCFGEMSATDAVMYCRGYAAAGRDPHDIWPELEKPS